MQTKHIAQATVKVLQSYLTYQAVLRIQSELGETNPSQAIWLNQYLASHNIQNGETFLTELLDENKELVLRILAVREDIAESVLDFLPGMARSSLTESNIAHRRHLLERLTRTVAEVDTLPSKSLDRESDSNDSPPS
ncbi:chaperonin family protein RbcX [Synechocystis sp. LEGE 06083]|uniref:chaperonin family protein RbcX n=1 Tax=Synechocystis sp. LEGE 06083 TaxID=915336 RepID=UPI00187E0056|nr:chaperonin family protein RbcX [Synechocystis sp. LEGE 06083]MBE9194953.1 chaperonin family protein RbcX [Synechocystis sp. LEGE 06083]